VASECDGERGAAWRFDPYAPGFDADPHPTLRTLREEHPVFWWDLGRAWLVSRYDDVASLLRDPRLGVDVRSWRYAAEVARTPIDEVYESGMFSLPPDAHARVRKLVGPAFSPRAVARRQPVIDALVGEILDAIGDAPRFDVATDVAGVLPVRVISRVLGIPSEHEEIFRRYAKAVIAGVHPMLRGSLDEGAIGEIVAGQRLLREVIETRRRAPDTDLLSELIAAEEAGDRLSTEDLQAIVTSLVIAGSDTTTHAIALGTATLLRHPEERARLAARPELLPNAIDETLRFEMFSKLGVPRYAHEKIQIHGVEIEPGEMVVPMLNAALRDPRRFPDPDRFDIARDQRHNIAFGQGPHYCIGAALARAEAQTALRALLDRFPGLALAAEPVFAPHPILRHVASVPVETRA
jgi:cytochrome P450 enzyme